MRNVIISIAKWALAAATFLPTIVHSQKILTSLREYDNLRANTTSSIERVGNIDVISVSDTTSDTKIGLCNLAMMMPFSFYPGPPPTTKHAPDAISIHGHNI